MKVLIIDSDTLSRRGIESLISKEINQAKVIAVSRIEECVSILSKQRIKLVIAELYYPETNLQDIYKFLDSIDIPVIVYTIYDTQGYIKTRLKNPQYTQLIISKTQPIEDLSNAIKYVSKENHKSKELKKTTQDYFVEYIPTVKEKTLIRELLKGKSLVEISSENGMNYSSLISLRKKIFKKYKINTLIDLFHIMEIYDL